VPDLELHRVGAGSPARAAFCSIPSMMRGQAPRGMSCPMPSIVSMRAPGIARAVARPPDSGTRRSLVPWTTSVGAMIVRSSGVRSPDAMIAASWRALPAGFSPRSKLIPAIRRRSSSSRSKPGDPILENTCTAWST
jgi:hypothetical protein